MLSKVRVKFEEQFIFTINPASTKQVMYLRLIIFGLLSDLDPHRLWILDEDFTAAHLILVGVHVYRLQEVQNALLFCTPPVWPRLCGEDGVPKVTIYGVNAYR